MKSFEFSLQNGIKIKYSANYHPKANEVVESSNKNLIKIIKKNVIKNQINWHSALSNALWEVHVTQKVDLGNSPYFLVYRKEVYYLPVSTFHLFNYLSHQEALLLYYNDKSIIRWGWRKREKWLCQNFKSIKCWVNGGLIETMWGTKT